MPQSLEKTVEKIHIGPWVNVNSPIRTASVYQGRPRAENRLGELSAKKLPTPIGEQRFELKYSGKGYIASKIVDAAVMESNLDSVAMRYLKEFYAV